MATDEKIIVAIELGSAKITGVAGCKQPDGGIQVLALAQEPSSSFIRKGRIFNIEKTKQCLINIKEKLSKDLNKPISQVYVGLAGQGLATSVHTIQRKLDAQTSITTEIVDSLLDSNLNTPMGNKEILEVVPQEYKVGTQLQADPVGVLTNRIEGRFLNITAPPSLRENIDKCFDQINLKIADHILSPLALGDIILSESERRSGCVLVDMGADTTTVSIYKNNILRQISVIPLGGSNVTKDLMTLHQLEPEEAERLKLEHGTAYAEVKDDGEDTPITFADGRTVEENVFLEITEARIEEIIVNVACQIKRSGYSRDKLLAGVIITGGMAETKNLKRAFQEHTEFQQYSIRKKLPINIRMPQGIDASKLGNINSVIALVDKGVENCCNQVAEPITTPNLFGNGGDTDLVDDPHGGTTDPTATPPTHDEGEEDKGKGSSSKKRKDKKSGVKDKLKKLWQKLGGLVTDDADPDILEKDK